MKSLEQFLTDVFCGGGGGGGGGGGVWPCGLVLCTAVHVKMGPPCCCALAVHAEREANKKQWQRRLQELTTGSGN